MTERTIPVDQSGLSTRKARRPHTIPVDQSGLANIAGPKRSRPSITESFAPGGTDHPAFTQPVRAYSPDQERVPGGSPEGGQFAGGGGGGSTGEQGVTSIVGVGDVAKFVADHPRQAGETIFGYQARMVGQLSPDQKHEMLYHIREKYPPVEYIQKAGDQYRADHGLANPKVDVSEVPAALAKAEFVGRAWETTPDQSTDPKVIAAYDDFKRQNDEMWTKMTTPVDQGGMGIKVDWCGGPDNPRGCGGNPGDGPYKGAEEQANDLRDNHHITIESGLGGEHPLLSRDEYDRFRAVHDTFGHTQVGSGFDRHGEYEAYLEHRSMYTGEGAKAMASEYHGVNSSLWSGNPGATPTGKALLMPDNLIPNPWDKSGNLVRAARSVPKPLVSADTDGLKALAAKLKLDGRFADKFDHLPWHYNETAVDQGTPGGTDHPAFEPVRAYSDDQPRDDHGRFTSGDGGGSGQDDTIGGSEIQNMIAAIGEPDGGFTIDPRDGLSVKEGFAVGIGGHSSITPETEFFAKGPDGEPNGVQVIRNFLDQNAERFDLNPGLMVGGWHDPVNHEIVLDPTRIVDNREEAIRLGFENNQLAVADLSAISHGDWEHAIIETRVHAPFIALQRPVRAYSADQERVPAGEPGGGQFGSGGGSSGDAGVGAIPKGWTARPLNVDDITTKIRPLLIDETQAEIIAQQMLDNSAGTTRYEWTNPNGKTVAVEFHDSITGEQRAQTLRDVQALGTANPTASDLTVEVHPTLDPNTPGGPMRPAVYGETGPTMVALNSNIYTPETADSIHAQAKDGWFVAAAADVPAQSYILAHEYGHAIDFDNSWNKPELHDSVSETMALRNDPLPSQYSGDARTEAYAEAFAAYWLKGDQSGEPMADHLAKSQGWKR